MNNIQLLAEAIKKSPAVVYTGAGVSTNSGIPDFRGTEGFYKKYHEDDLAVEAFFRDPDTFYIAFQEKFSHVFNAEPNDTHLILSELEEMGLVSGIITQNVDRLHHAAGSKNIIEFHGNIFTYDMISITDKHHMNYRILQSDIDINQISNNDEIIYRNGRYIYKPQVVLFGEGITKWSESADLSRQCNVHIIMGTSYQVTPFNMLSYENKSDDLQVFVINNEPIKYYGPCTQIIGDTSEILTKLKTYL